LLGEFLAVWWCHHAHMPPPDCTTQAAFALLTLMDYPGNLQLLPVSLSARSCKLNIITLWSIVRCIARQQTDKHLATEYTHATIE
jgi:hypothetical protein